MSLDATILKNFITTNGLKYKQTSNSYIFKCPNPECGKEGKFYLKKNNGIFICWVCGLKGSRPEYALSKLLGMPLPEVCFELYGTGEVRGGKYLEDIDLDEFEYIDDRIVSLKPVAFPYDFYELDDPRSVRGLEYLKSRGIDYDIAKQYNIKYCPTQRRVIFPAEYDGKLYGWQGRWIIPGEPRMINSKSEESWRSQVLMFMDRMKGSPHCVLAEGPVDAIAAHLCGGNVCTMGKQVSPMQLNVIRRMGVEKVYLALDPDAAESTQKIIKDLTKDLKCYLMTIPDAYKDIGEMDMKDAFELFKGAKEVNSSRLFLYLKNEK